MTSREHDELTRLMLGELPDEQRERLEARLLAETALQEQAEALEADLADAYARGQLGPDQRAAWEERLSASARMRERDEFARTFGEVLAREAAVGPRRVAWWRRFALPDAMPGLRLALAAGLVVALAAAGWFGVQAGPRGRRFLSRPEGGAAHGGGEARLPAG